MLIRPDAHAWDSLIGRHAPDQPDTPTRLRRAEPFGLYVDDWYETLGFTFVVPNGNVETHSFRRMFGPWRLHEFIVTQSATDARNMHVYLTDDDTDADPAAAFSSASRVPSQFTTDTTSQTPSVNPAVTVPSIHPGYFSNRGISRIAIVCENNQAAPQSLWGVVVVCHLKAANGSPDAY